MTTVLKAAGLVGNGLLVLGDSDIEVWLKGLRGCVWHCVVSIL
jgi:hypothetical protein